MNGRQASDEGQFEMSSSHLSKRQKTFHNGPGHVVHEPGNDLSIPRHYCYTIAWICALPEEMAAARAMLDDIHEPLATHTNDNNTYILGSIRQHNVVIACLPNAQYGTNNAANVLTHLIRTFPSIRLGLIVGIGGGVPSMVDMRLGDIVVGTRVMQYDLGKIVQGGQTQRTAVWKIPHQLLGTAVSALRAEHELEPSRIPSILRQKLGGHADYGCPSSPDRLFAATYEHTSPTPGCDGCEDSKLIPRRARASRDPTIHYGAIASGNQVVKDGATRDKIARQLDAICFEMEAAGLMDILPCLPIRGICDYSDSHKNKDWQRYAAATAAAYARELLEILPATDSSTKASYSLKICQDPLDDHRKRILDSLKYEQIDSRKLTIKSAHAKTCRWFLSHPDYQAWLDPGRLTEHHGFLWIRGKPGAGKSTIMKFIYAQTKKKIQSAHSVVASFFFNARGEQLEKSISGMYRSLLLQLLEGYPDLQAVLDDTDLVPQDQNGCPHLNVLRELFSNAVSSLDQRSFTCFIDALDECDEQQVRAMVQDLEDLAENSTERAISLRICFSSRHYPYIVLQQGIQLILEDQRGHSEDLSNYINNRLEIKDITLAEELREQILGKAAGVFLWVALVVDILNKENRRGRLQSLSKRLSELPNLRLCVLWILCARRPLRPEEYRHALWSGLFLKGLADDEGLNAPGSDVVDNIGNCVINSSKGIAEITKSKCPTVQFIHESVRDFLVKDKGLQELWPDLGFDWESPSNEMLKQSCNTYINHPSVRARISKMVSDARENKNTKILNECPFLEYASQNILYHANAAAVAVPQDNFLSGFPVPDWISIINLFEKHKVRLYNPDTSLLYILAESNLANLIRIHPRREFWLDVENERYGTPLFAALALGSHEAVQTFLEVKACTQPADSSLHNLCKLYTEKQIKSTGLGRSFHFSKRKGILYCLEKHGDEMAIGLRSR
ncbi:hypothetical protein ABW19_dt0201894 [Dactylella cylindrospora]|nr:hypothetical protein ABW19_dt0201894 [Dactylella cylindrospora]